MPGPSSRADCLARIDAFPHGGIADRPHSGLLRIVRHSDQTGYCWPDLRGPQCACSQDHGKLHTLSAEGPYGILLCLVGSSRGGYVPSSWPGPHGTSGRPPTQHTPHPRSSAVSPRRRKSRMFGSRGNSQALRWPRCNQEPKKQPWKFSTCSHDLQTAPAFAP